MGCSESWPFRFNIIRCVGTQHIWTWSGVTERKGRTILFLPVKPRNLGARGLRQKVRESARPTFAREISTIENGAGIQNSRNENAVISLSVRYGGRDISGRGFAYEWIFVFQDFQDFQNRGVCAVKDKGSFQNVKNWFKSRFCFFLKLYIILVYIEKTLERC